MTDDPREVLKAAGVECHALDEYQPFRNRAKVSTAFAGTVIAGHAVVRQDKADAAVLALARLVARYGYQLNLACVDICILVEDGPREGSSSAVHADLDRRWEEHNA